MGLENLKSAFSDIQQNVQRYTPNKGGTHGADIDFDGTPVLSTPFYEIEKMTSAFGMIGSEVNFLSRLEGTNSYFEPVDRISGFNNNFEKGGYSFADGQLGNSKFVGIESNLSFDTPDNIYGNSIESSLIDFPPIQLGEIQIHPIANDLVQLNQYSQMNLSDIIDNYNTLPDSTKLFDNYNYDPRLENLYFGNIAPILNVNSYGGTKFDDGVGGLFNNVENTSDFSKKYSTTFRTINIPSGFITSDGELGGQVFTDGNIVTGEGYPNQNIAFEKFKSAFELGEGIKYSPNPNTFETNLPVSNTPITNNFVSDRIVQTTNLGNDTYQFSNLYNTNHTPKDSKLGPGNVKAKLSLQNSTHNSGYRGNEPYIVSDIGNDDTKNSSRYWQLSRTLVDEKRIFEFMKTEAGLWFMAKQNLLGLNTRVIVEDDTQSGIQIGTASLFKETQTKATGQRFKRWYSPLSTMASAFRIGGGGFPNVLVDREFPFGELAGLFGAARDYSDYVSKRPSNRNYKMMDSMTQPQNGSNTFLQQIGQSLSEAIPGLQQSPKDPPKIGDKMTLMDIAGGTKTTQGGNPYGSAPSSYASKNKDLDELEKSKNGMPFYFRDMRTGKYLIFRAYVTGLTENIQPSWNSENYIGRSEPVYIYDKTERDIAFTLTLHAGTINELEAIYTKMNVLTSLCYPQYKTDNLFTTSGTTTTTTAENLSFGKMRMKPPLTMMRMGELYGTQMHELMGFVKSLTYSFPDNTTWETIRGKRVPKLVTVAISYQVVHASVPGITYDETTDQMTTTRFTGWAGDTADERTPNKLKQKIQPDIVIMDEPGGISTRTTPVNPPQNPNI